MAGSSDRGQAYTLESLIAALLLVTAVLFALQSVVITPTSAGTLDRDVQAQLEQEASDVLVTAANDGELSRMARYWECKSGGEGFADDSNAGVWVPNQGYSDDVAPIEDFGETLNHTFDEGTRYNVELVYSNGSEQNVSRIVYQGTPGDEVVTASYTVTLTDTQPVTGPDPDGQTLADCDPDPNGSSAYPTPIPHDYSGPVYNVVEVRVVLW